MHDQRTREARTALRETLKREPTAGEIHYLALGEAALGDKTLSRIQRQNALKTLSLLRHSRQELLREMRKKRQQMLKLRAKAGARASRKKKLGRKPESQSLNF